MAKKSNPYGTGLFCSYTIDKPNRKQYLKASKENGKVVYSSII